MVGLGRANPTPTPNPNPFEAVVLCGSDHADGEELLAPHVLKLALASE